MVFDVIALYSWNRGARWMSLAAGVIATAGTLFGASLRESVETALHSGILPDAGLGVEIISLDSGKVIARTNAHRPFVPASTTKVFTSSLALDRLGGDYRIETTLLATTPPTRKGLIRGDLFIIGRGDPSVQWQRAAASEGTRLGRLVDVLLDAGVRELDGDLVLDATYFADAPYGLGWAWDDLDEEYGAPVSALTVNNNCIQLKIQPGSNVGDKATVDVLPLLPSGMSLQNRLTTGPSNQPPAVSMERLPGTAEVVLRGVIPQGAGALERGMPVADPAVYFGECFSKEMRLRGVRHRGGIRIIRPTAERRPELALERLHSIGAIYSAPLTEIVRDMMKPSDNTRAQLLWLQCGAVARAYPNDQEILWPLGASTTETTRRQLADFLKRAEVQGNEVQIEEGAGLSRANLITPAAMVAVLRFMNTHPWGAAFREALPVGGRDGTLRGRFTSDGVRDRVVAKTGSLRNVTTLAGYVTSAAGERFAFAIFINQNMAGAAKARAEMDRLVELLARETARSE